MKDLYFGGSTCTLVYCHLYIGGSSPLATRWPAAWVCRHLFSWWSSWSRSGSSSWWSIIIWRVKKNQLGFLSGPNQYPGRKRTSPNGFLLSFFRYLMKLEKCKHLHNYVVNEGWVIEKSFRRLISTCICFEQQWATLLVGCAGFNWGITRRTRGMWRHHNRAAGQEGDDPKSGLDPKLGGKGGKSVQHVRQKKIDWI